MTLVFTILHKFEQIIIYILLIYQVLVGWSFTYDLNSIGNHQIIAFYILISPFSDIPLPDINYVKIY